MSFVQQLVEFGFDVERAQEAAKHRTTLESAMDWLVAQDQSGSMEVDQTTAAAASAAPAAENIVEQLVEMGFDVEKATEAAKICSTVETAMNWIVSRQEAEAMETDPAASAAIEESAAAKSAAPTAAPAAPAAGSVAAQLIEMGYDAAVAAEAGKNCTTIETATSWIAARQEAEAMECDPAAAAAIEESAAAAAAAAGTAAPAVVAASYRCNDCGKVMANEHVMMFHASKTGHGNFEESTDSIKPLTEEEKKEQAAKLKEKIKESMQKKAQLEEIEKIEKEKKRVQDGKAMRETNEKRKEMEQLAAIAQRKREKQEEEAAKKRVLEQIKADREARKAAAAGLPPPTPAPAPAPVVPVEKKDYKEATIQIRLPSGEVIRNTFPADQELSAVRSWLESTKPELVPFALLQPFPRKIMTSEDFAAPLADHGLVPSGSLVVTRAQ